MRIFCLIACLCAAGLAHSECRFADRSIENSIRTYQLCVENGEPAKANVKSALGHAPQDNASYKSAIDEFTLELESAPESSAKPYFHRGLAYLAIGKERQALRDFENYSSQTPDSQAGHFYKGVALLERRKYRDAINAFETALSVNSQNTITRAPILFAKARAELSTRSREQALVSLDSAISSDSEYAKAYFERARLREKSKQPAQAIEDYTRYIELRPQSAEACYNRGLIYQDLRQDHLAIQDFDRAIERDPGYLKPRASKGLTYLWPVLPVLLVLMAG